MSTCITMVEAIEGERPREFKCDGCGVVFAPKGKKLYTYWSKIRDGTFRHAFCSRECVCEYNIVEYGKPATVGTCCDCGSEFTRATKEGSRKLSAAIRMGANVYCVSCRGARAGKRNGNSVRSRLHQKIVDTGYKCALSGVTLTPSTFAIDHIVPLSKGGASDDTNLQFLHAIVNRMKGTMEVSEFIEWCGRIYNNAKQTPQPGQ